MKSDMIAAISRLRQLTIPALHHDFVELLSDVKGKLSGEYMELMDRILLYDSQHFEVRLSDVEQFCSDDEYSHY